MAVIGRRNNAQQKKTKRGLNQLIVIFVQFVSSSLAFCIARWCTSIHVTIFSMSNIDKEIELVAAFELFTLEVLLIERVQKCKRYSCHNQRNTVQRSQETKMKSSENYFEMVAGVSWLESFTYKDLLIIHPKKRKSWKFELRKLFEFSAKLYAENAKNINFALLNFSQRAKALKISQSVVKKCHKCLMNMY